jgi:hypothetical protein
MSPNDWAERRARRSAQSFGVMVTTAGSTHVFKLIRLAAPHALLQFLAGCDDGKPIATEKSRLLSPDGVSVAVLEGVDNGLGFGQGMYYDEIHVGPAGLSISDHGDGDPSVVFYAAQEASTDDAPSLHWLNARHLIVTYDLERRPQKLVTVVSGIQIEYRPSAKP